MGTVSHTESVAPDLCLGMHTDRPCHQEQSTRESQQHHNHHPTNHGYKSKWPQRLELMEDLKKLEPRKQHCPREDVAGDVIVFEHSTEDQTGTSPADLLTSKAPLVLVFHIQNNDFLLIYVEK